MEQFFLILILICYEKSLFITENFACEIQGTHVVLLYLLNAQFDGSTKSSLTIK